MPKPVDRRHGEIRTALERAGTPIGANDLLIAAHALAHGLILVTANEDEFRRVRGACCRELAESRGPVARRWSSI